MKKLITLGLAVSLAAGSLIGCGSGGGNETTPAAESGSTEDTTAADNEETTTGESISAEGGVLKIGGIGPLTGDTAIYGQAVKNGAEIAIEEINAAGGINGMQIEFRYEDDEHDSETAVNAYNQLKDWDMQVLMGTVTSTPCLAVADKSNQDNIYQLTPSGTAVDCVQYDNAFRVCFSDPSQGAASAIYIGEHELAQKIAVIYDSSDVYSSGIYETFATEAKNQNFEIVAAEAFTGENKTDFNVQLQKAQAAGAELIFLPIYYGEVSQILIQADKLGFEPMYFGCDGLDGLLTVDNFDTELAEDVMLLTPFAADAKDDLTVQFVEKYQAAYGGIPNQFAADAYDAIYIIKAAAEEAGITSDMSASDICEALKPAMTEITVSGLTGNSITWTADGEPEKDPKAVKIVNGEYTAMD